MHLCDREAVREQQRRRRSYLMTWSLGLINISLGVVSSNAENLPTNTPWHIETASLSQTTGQEMEV
jgi:hypothetical protein